MRRARIKAKGNVAYYHCISRVVNRAYVFGEVEKEAFVRIMRRYEAFCGVRVVTYCVMSNHFHVLVEVPERPPKEREPSDEELVALVKKARMVFGSGTLKQDLERLRAEGQHEAAEALRERFLSRMWDVSWFIRLVKQRFSMWFNKQNRRSGTLWEERFKSVLVEGKGRALLTMAAYIDLNPVRAGMVGSPEAYRWSGFGEASAGSRAAREGLAVAAHAARGEEVAANRVMAEYRLEVYGRGEESTARGELRPKRRGVTRERVEEVKAAGGKLPAWEALRCRVRYFSDGVVLGSKAFVEEHFVEHRGRFGPRRKTGARKMRYVEFGDLCTVRDLQKEPVLPSG